MWESFDKRHSPSQYQSKAIFTYYEYLWQEMTIRHSWKICCNCHLPFMMIFLFTMFHCYRFDVMLRRWSVKLGTTSSTLFCPRLSCRLLACSPSSYLLAVAKRYARRRLTLFWRSLSLLCKTELYTLGCFMFFLWFLFFRWTWRWLFCWQILLFCYWCPTVYHSSQNTCQYCVSCIFLCLIFIWLNIVC